MISIKEKLNMDYIEHTRRHVHPRMGSLNQAGLPYGTDISRTEYMKRYRNLHPQYTKQESKRQVEANRKRREKDLNYSLYYLRFLFKKTRETKLFIQSTTNKRQKKLLFNLLGNRCKNCGESNINVLQVHHLYGRNTTHSKNYYELMREAKLNIIVLLCANCHILIHNGLISLKVNPIAIKK